MNRFDMLFNNSGLANKLLQALGAPADALNPNNIRIDTKSTPIANSYNYLPQQQAAPIEATKTISSNNVPAMSESEQPVVEEQVNIRSIPKRKSNGFFDSPVVQTLNDIFAGWASGRNDSESLGLGGRFALAGSKQRHEQNKTFNWLVNNGFAEDQADQIVKDPNLLRQVLVGRNNQYQYFQTPDAKIVRVNKNSGEAEPIYNGDINRTNRKENNQIVVKPDGKILLIDRNTGMSSVVEDPLQKGQQQETPIVTLNGDGVPDKDLQQKYLDTAVPENLRTIVKQVADGQIPLERIPAKQRLEITRYASGYDPNFDSNHARNVYNLQRNYDVGDMFKVRNAGNLTLQHLIQLKNSYNKLNNSGSPILNAGQNYLASTLGITDKQRRDALATYETARTALASELAKLFNGSGVPAQKLIDEWVERLSPDAAPSQFKEATDALVHLLSSRAESYRTGYENVKGQGTARPFLDDNTVKALLNAGFAPDTIKEIDPRFDLSAIGVE